eukprot:344311_1
MTSFLHDLIASFKEEYSKDEKKLIVYGYCKIYYIAEYYDFEKYSFPVVIIDLISQYLSIVNLYSEAKTYTKMELVGLPKRIMKEIIRFQNNPFPGINIIVHPQNYRYFLIEFEGPKDSPYYGGIYHAELFLTKEYPHKPPNFRFVTKMFHPNIDKLGRECLDVTGDKWSPALTIQRVMLSELLMLKDPNPDDPLDNQVSEIWKSDIKQAHKMVKEYMIKFAIPNNKMLS